MRYFFTGTTAQLEAFLANFHTHPKPEPDMKVYEINVEQLDEAQIDELAEQEKLDTGIDPNATEAVAEKKGTKSK